MTGPDPEGGQGDAGSDIGPAPREPGPPADSQRTDMPPAARLDGAPASPAAGPRLGTSTFTIEGRAAPGLFVVGWLATLMGAGILVGGLLAGSGPAAVALFVAGLILLAVGLVSGAGSQAVERHARGIAGYAGPAPVLVFLAVIPLAVLLEIVSGIPMTAAGVDERSPLGFLVGLLVIVAVYLSLIRLLVVGTGSLSWRDMGVRRPGVQQLTELAIGALMAFPLIVLTGLLATALATFLHPPAGTLPLTGGAAGMLVNLVSAMVVAPVGEEVFFRGFATTAWLRGAGANAAIVRGALLFALAHVLTAGGDTFLLGLESFLFAFLVRVPVALALGWVFVRSRSIYASIGLHALFNGVPVLVLLLTGSS